MINPLDLQTKDFKPSKILMNHDSFVIAEGKDNMNYNCIAMRWMTTDSTSGHGFPLSHGNPVWFIIHYDIAEIVLIGLLHGSDNIINKNEILEILANVYSAHESA